MPELFLELDLGWAWYAGVDPVDARHARGGPRAARAHQGLPRPSDEPSYCPVGDGAVGYEHVAPAARRRGRRMAARRAGRGRRAPSSMPPRARSPRSTRRRGGRVNAAGPRRDRRLRCDQPALRRERPRVRLVRHRRLRRPRPARSEALAAEHGFAACIGRGAHRRPDDRRRPQPDAADGPRRRDPGGARGRQARLHREAARDDVAEAPRSSPRRDRLGLRIGCAPDIFLGGAYQAARALIDEGAIGEPLSASAAMLLGGQDDVAPRPGHLLRGRRRPAARHGALLPDGPRRAARPGPRRHRLRVDADRRADDRDRPARRRAFTRVDADTHDRRARARRRRHGDARRELRGAEPVRLRPPRSTAPTACSSSRSERLRRRRPAAPRPRRLGGRRLHLARARESRGLGLAEMVEAIDARRPHRASGELGQHVVAVARAILEAAAKGRASRSAIVPRSRRRCPCRSTPRPHSDDGASLAGEVPLLHEDGIAFRDRNRNGRLDPFEDPPAPGRRAGRRPARPDDARGEGRDDVPPGRRGRRRGRASRGARPVRERDDVGSRLRPRS